MKATNRDFTVDLVKILCMTWIVGFWHLADYGDAFNTRFPYSGEITHAVMGVFMFWGGYFLQKYKIHNKADAIAFYKKRFSRFYFLYLFSILTLYVGGLFTVKPWFKSIEQLILTIFGLSAFNQPNVGTLWFMSMLMFFYILTPYVNAATSARQQLYRSFLPFLFLVLYKVIFGAMLDSRIFMLYITFFTGLVIPHDFCSKYLKSSIALCAGLLLFFVFASLKGETIFTACFYRTIYTIGAIFTLYYCCYVINKMFGQYLTRIMQILSYLLMAMYLFHRQIYQSLELVFNRLNINITAWMDYVIFLPIGLIVAYIIQSIYDKIYKTVKT